MQGSQLAGHVIGVYSLEIGIGEGDGVGGFDFLFHFSNFSDWLVLSWFVAREEI